MPKIAITKSELIWPGKYDEDGRRVINRGVALPFQVVETIREGRASREPGRRADLFRYPGAAHPQPYRLAGYHRATVLAPYRRADRRGPAGQALRRALPAVEYRKIPVAPHGDSSPEDAVQPGGLLQRFRGALRGVSGPVRGHRTVRGAGGVVYRVSRAVPVHNRCDPLVLSSCFFASLDKDEWRAAPGWFEFSNSRPPATCSTAVRESRRNRRCS